MDSLSAVNFYSFLMDGTTDAGRVEDELIAVLHCIKDDNNELIGSVTRFFSVQVPSKADSSGLIQCVGNALRGFGLEPADILDCKKHLEIKGKPIMIGGGTDGASVNIGDQNGMKGKMQEALPWLLLCTPP